MPDTVFLVNPASANGDRQALAGARAPRAAARARRRDALLGAPRPPDRAGPRGGRPRRAARRRRRRRRDAERGRERGRRHATSSSRCSRTAPARTSGAPTGSRRASTTRSGSRSTARRATIDVGRVRYRTWAATRRALVRERRLGRHERRGRAARELDVEGARRRATFFYALTRVFLAWKNTEVTVRLDDAERRGRMHDVIVANGAWHGGGMKLAPDAQPDDGLFDVVLIGDVTQARLRHHLAEALQGRPRQATRRSRCCGARASRSTRPSACPIELDGEQVGTTPAAFEVVPGALRVRVPA